ncbi:sensor histidine kinase [Vibrio comitans]
MKIRTSLRLYVVAAMLLSGAVVVLGMSGLAISYFFYGLDTATIGNMRSKAYEVEVSDGQPVKLHNMTIATRWQDLPESIRNIFDHNELEIGQLQKQLDGIPLLQRPKRARFVVKLSHDGKVRFVSTEYNELQPEDFKADHSPKFRNILFIGLGAMILFGAVLAILIRRVSLPVHRLRDWAKQLDKKQLGEPAPDFNYIELNTLAEIIQSSLSSVQESLAREERFLGYASHELRTPIAATRSNTELLQKMIERGIKSEKQLEVLNRIHRASFTMTDLTETLLWLNRQESKALLAESMVFGDLVEKIQSELHYLLEGKTVQVELSRDSTVLDIPKGLGRIVISNLIRNAFQHTYDGNVVIEQNAHRLVITNTNKSDATDHIDLGFGLGLELTDRLVKQCGWFYQNEPLENGRRVEIHFVNESD